MPHIRGFGLGRTAEGARLRARARGNHMRGGLRSGGRIGKPRRGRRPGEHRLWRVLTTRAGSTAARLEQGSEVGVLACRSGCSSWRSGRAGGVVELASRMLLGASLAARPVQAILIVAFRDDVRVFPWGARRSETTCRLERSDGDGSWHGGDEGHHGATHWRPESANGMRATATERWCGWPSGAKL